MTDSALQRSSQSHLLVAVVGFVLGSSITLIATLAIHKDWRLHTNKKSIDKKSEKNEGQQTGSRSLSSSSKTTSGAKQSVSLPLEIREEQLSRHTLYFGEQGMKRLLESRICVVGLGGVGSHTAHMLALGGVGYLRLIDFDQVSLSSLNRHACATLADVGLPKATCLQKYLRQLCPDPKYLQLDACVEMYTTETGPRLLDLSATTSSPDSGTANTSGWDVVIDAIDDVPTKAALIAHCLSEGIPVLSCMGAGGKADMTRLHVSDLKTAAKDPLASKLRQSLKKLMKSAKTIRAHTENSGDVNIDDDDDYLENMDRLAIVFSSEKPVVKLADFTPQQKEEGVHKFGAVDGMRIRILPVLGTMPAIMGQALAALALTQLGGKPISNPVTGERLGRGARHKLHQRIKHREEVMMKEVLQELTSVDDTEIAATSNDIRENGRNVQGDKWVGPLQIDMDDVEYLVELWRNRCAVSGKRVGVVLELIRWDLSRPSTPDNIVVMSVGEINKFTAANHNKDHIPEAVRLRIEERLASCSLD